MSPFPQRFNIFKRDVGEQEPCLIIAEAGVSHFGDINKAYALVDMACDAGADIFKIQHFKTDLLIGPSSVEWRNRLRPKELTDEMVRSIQNYCHQKGIAFLCTAHDEASLEFIDHQLNVPAFKIGSGELNNWPFLINIASRKKPIILSTGMYTLDEIKTSVRLISEAGCPALAILHCVTNYPADPEQINLGVMQQIAQFFDGPIGYSDHTDGTAICLAAVSMGAKIIEKHITLEKNIPNAQDWKVACDPSNFKDFIQNVRIVEKAIRGGVKQISASEEKSKEWACKSLTAKQFIPCGSSIETSMITAQRPGIGIPPSQINQVVGSVAKKDLLQGEVILKDSLSC